jgi:hypothetical protein
MRQIRNWSRKLFATSGEAHLESRGKHTNRPHKTTSGTKSMNTFSHLKQEGLPEDLNVCKLHEIYSAKFLCHPVSHER